MSNIKMQDIQEVMAVNPVEAEQVKGGPAYIKFDGVDGESRSVQSGGAHFAFGDGSVRF
ncbi:MAG: hypothetical protein KF886_00725 [Candidatus Hydrogenedentes bacterium]|nr:hypothetical protein [Candidatus Hydrogenedentota bacterium]